VHSISASWRVPRIVWESKPAHAGTWIGTEGLRAFIQVGTAVDTESHWQYYAWWTDTASHELPHYLFPVRPGDTIRATLVHERPRWLVMIRDETSGRRAVFSTTQEGRASFGVAEWIQESPSVRAFSYPRLSLVTFEHLLTNGVPPRGAELYWTWLSTGEGLLAPTPLKDDAFTLRPATITAEDTQYLRIVEPFNTAARGLDRTIAGWRQRTSGWQHIRAAEHAYGAGLGKLDMELQSAHWSVTARPFVATVIRAARVSARALASLPAVKPPSSGRLASEWRQDGNEAQQAARAARRALDLPDPPFPILRY
jgi:Peptidase A4 family